MASEERRRGTYLSVPQMENLQHACRFLTAAEFDTYLVGSVLSRPDYRDVDLRCILADAQFDALVGQMYGARHRLLNLAITEWIAARTGLPIDFQFQRRTDANAQFEGNRNFVGVPIEALART